MITDLAAFSGMEMENMTRGHGWRFLDIGRRLERALNMTRLVRSAIDGRPSQDAMLEPLLEIADSSMTYRRRYFAEPQLPPVLDLLLADGTNPRALAFQLDAMSERCRTCRATREAPSPTREERLIAHAVEALRAADFDALSQPGADVAFERLTALLDLLDEDLRGSVGHDHLLLLQSCRATCQLTPAGELPGGAHHALRLQRGGVGVASSGARHAARAAAPGVPARTSCRSSRRRPSCDRIRTTSATPSTSSSWSGRTRG